FSIGFSRHLSRCPLDLQTLAESFLQCQQAGIGDMVVVEHESAETGQAACDGLGAVIADGVLAHVQELQILKDSGFGEVVGALVGQMSVSQGKMSQRMTGLATSQLPSPGVTEIVFR